MPKSVLEAIKLGFWDFEPPEVEYSKFTPPMRCQEQRRSSRCLPSGSVAVCLCGTRPIGANMETPPWWENPGSRGSAGAVILCAVKTVGEAPCA